MAKMFLFFFFCPLALADGVGKTYNSGSTSEHRGSSAKDLTPEQIQEVFKAYSKGSRNLAGTENNSEDLKHLLEEVKKLNSVVKERNKTLDQLMKEP